MTIITKPSLNIKKTPLINKENPDEEVIEINQAPARVPTKRPPAFLAFMAVTALILATTGITITGMMLYTQFMKNNSGHRYKGFCSIPIPVSMDPLLNRHQRVMPLRWTQNREVQVVSTVDMDTSNEALKALREEFDIGDAVEKISVFDDGRQVNFIHDFDNNVTGIVDDDRCFMMDLDLDSVLPPDTLVVGMQEGSDFDISRVHTTLHAVLPALRNFAQVARMLVDKCVDKPTYKLQKEEGLIIRKRSVDAPPHDYMQFAGKHIQEIEIANINDILYDEQLHNNRTAGRN